MPAETSKFVFNENQVKAHFSLIEDSINKTIGKPLHNPMLWVNKVVQPLIDRFKKGERTEELQKAILALPTSPEQPTMTKTWTSEMTKGPVTPSDEPTVKPIGLKLS